MCEEAEHLGSWSEGCACHSDRTAVNNAFHLRVRVQKANQRKLHRPRGFMSDIDCPFKGCRAVEFASGQALESLRSKMLSNRDKILAHVATSDNTHRNETLADWQQARSRLWST